jgi:hypothetical protein
MGSSYETAFLPYQTPQGEHRLGFVVKRTLDVRLEDGRAVPAGKPRPIDREDVFWDGGDVSCASLQAELELTPPKPGVDVILQGTAVAPGGVATTEFEVSLRLGGVKRRLRILGDRQVIFVPPQKESPKDPLKRVPSIPRFTDPQPIEKLPLRYEFAYGGRSYLIPLQPEVYEAAKAKALAEAAANSPPPPPAPDKAPEPVPPSAGTEGRPVGEAQWSGATQVLEVAAVEAAQGAGVGGVAGAGLVGEDGTLKQEAAGRHVVADVGDWTAGLRNRPVQAQVAPQEVELPFDRVGCVSNPVGRGFALGNFKETLDGLKLPNIEDPDHPVTPENLVVPQDRPLDVPVPAGWGWFGRGWFPRALYWGMDEATRAKAQEQQDQLVLGLDPEKPDDRAKIEALIDRELPLMDPRAWHGAHPSMILQELAGDEEVSLSNVRAEGAYFFRLPGLKPQVAFDRGRGEEPVAVKLDTLVINTDEHWCTLTWRGSVPYSGPQEFDTYRRFEVHARDADEELQGEGVTYRPKGQPGMTQVIDLAALEDKPAGRGATAGKPPVAVPGMPPARPRGEWVAERDDGGTRILRAQGNVQVEDQWVVDERERAVAGAGPSEAERARAAAEELARRKAELRARVEAARAAEAKKK